MPRNMAERLCLFLKLYHVTRVRRCLFVPYVMPVHAKYWPIRYNMNVTRLSRIIKFESRLVMMAHEGCTNV